MPRVTIKTGVIAENGREVELAEYLCDSPDCPNVATHVVGYVRESGLSDVVCDEHATGMRPRDTATKQPPVPPSDRA